jgi:biotin synthase
MNDRISQLAQKSLRREPLTAGDALFLATRTGAEREDVFHAADRIRRRFHGDRVSTCAIVSARQGRCSQDCAFCAQSAHHDGAVPEWDLIETGAVLEAARNAAEAGAESFGIVTSGRGLAETAGDVDRVAHAAACVAGSGLRVCASLGHLAEDALARLKAAGLRRLHHNLETSRAFYPRVCSTQSWDERLEMLRRAKKAGFEVCAGGLFGLGETWRDRVDLALVLHEIEVDAVPLNFLVPRSGTPLAGRPPLPALEALSIVALFRFVLPDREIKVCGGREAVLGDLQSWIFRAGASGLMIGNYLTTRGRPAEVDLRMLRDLGLRLRRPPDAP